jgi:hypothetical protein
MLFPTIFIEKIYLSLYLNEEGCEKKWLFLIKTMNHLKMDDSSPYYTKSIEAYN